ncbi:folylpolyglutamate synthase [Tilletia horrida]|nr:folylpolyglutamate synthase [Tilletia horrida]
MSTSTPVLDSTAPPPPGAIVLGLDRITTLLQRLNNPHSRFPVIHVAGTNAKGSTTAYLDALLSRAVGFRTGRFNSPHLVTERDTCSLSDGQRSQVMPSQTWKEASRLVQTADRGSDTVPQLQCTPFELLTATAFQAFDLLSGGLRPEILIIEVGLGGALDATNVFPTRNVLASVICPVDLDHESLLGSTLREIALAKSGIIKAGGLCVLADQRRTEDLDDQKAIGSSTAVLDSKVEAQHIGSAAATILQTVAEFCDAPSSTSSTQVSAVAPSARLVRAHAPFQALSPPIAPGQGPSGIITWPPRQKFRLSTTPTLCTPRAAVQRYDDDDDFADGGLGHSVQEAMSRLQASTQYVPDPAIHPDVYDDELTQSSGLDGRSAAQTILDGLPAHEIRLPTTRAVLSAASTAVSTLHGIARDLPLLIPGSAQRDIHSFDPWEEHRLRIAYGLTESGGQRVTEVLESGVRWRGRCEWVRLGKPGSEDSVLPRVLLDGAHNPSSASALREYLDTSIATLATSSGGGVSKPIKTEITWIMAFSKGKDIKGMVETLLLPKTPASAPEGTDLTASMGGMSLSTSQSASSPLITTQRVGLCPFATPVEGMPWVRPTEPAESAAVIRQLPQEGQQMEVKECGSLEEAVSWAATTASHEDTDVLQVTVICGSLYLVGECYALAGEFLDCPESRKWSIEPV